MLQHKNGNKFLIVLGLVFFSTSVFIHSKYNKPDLIISKQDTALNLSRDFVRLGSIGNKRLISNIMWIQTLLEADVEHYQKSNQVNWLYLRFLSISELDPKFYENYLWGGMYLSIIKDDVEGAAEIFERGLKHYPEDYKLNYNAGFNYYFEMGDNEKGLEKLEKIMGRPESPPGLPFIVNKLRFETEGSYEAALSFLWQRLKTTKDPVLTNKLSADIYALKTQRDLECLNLGKQNCDKIDAEGKFYKYSNGKWKANKEVKPYKIFRKK